MTWSPFQRANAGIRLVEQPGDYANQFPTTPATAPVGLTGLRADTAGLSARPTCLSGCLTSPS